EKKLSNLACPDKWKEGSRNAKVGKDRKGNESKLPSGKKKDGMTPYGRRCRLCKGSLHQQGAHYCQACAYKKGICAMCGIKMLDVSSYTQSSK
ncbi:PDZ-binding protein, partial [Piptocephalis cylindrospora]